MDLQLMIKQINNKDQNTMKNSHQNDYVYYEWRVKNIRKNKNKRGHFKSAIGKVEFSQVDSNCGKQAINGVEQFSAKIKKQKMSSVYQINIAEMQKAVNQQQAMYERFFYGGQQDITPSIQNPSSQSSILSFQFGQQKATNLSEYFSQLLDDPQDKFNLLFSETQLNLQEKVGMVESVGEYDVSEYFNV